MTKTKPKKIQSHGLINGDVIFRGVIVDNYKELQGKKYWKVSVKTSKFKVQRSKNEA